MITHTHVCLGVFVFVFPVTKAKVEMLSLDNRTCSGESLGSPPKKPTKHLMQKGFYSGPEILQNDK